MKLSYCTFSAPWGGLRLCAHERALVGAFVADDCAKVASVGLSPVLAQAVSELDEYFAGERKEFGVPLDFGGFAQADSSARVPTEFTLDVWRALLGISYGETRTYAEVAHMVGRPRAARAVGNAINKNPLMIFAPCHRVVGTSNPWGFACGPNVKRTLLKLEGSI